MVTQRRSPKSALPSWSASPACSGSATAFSYCCSSSFSSRLSCSSPSPFSSESRLHLGFRVFRSRSSAQKFKRTDLQNNIGILLTLFKWFRSLPSLSFPFPFPAPFSFLFLFLSFSIFFPFSFVSFSSPFLFSSPKKWLMIEIKKTVCIVLDYALPTAVVLWRWNWLEFNQFCWIVVFLFLSLKILLGGMRGERGGKDGEMEGGRRGREGGGGCSKRITASEWKPSSEMKNIPRIDIDNQVRFSPHSVEAP